MVKTNGILSDLQLQEEALAALKTRLGDGVTKQQLESTGEPFDDLCLRRWLAAEDFVVEKAEKRLRAHAIYRADYVKGSRIEEHEVANELAAQKVFLQGVTKSGQPLILALVERHVTSKRIIEENIRFIWWTMDEILPFCCTERNGGRKVSSIFSLGSIGLQNLDNAILKAIFDILTNHYPERLGFTYMLDAPTIFWGLWKVVSPFIDPVVRSKVKFIYSQKKDSPEWKAFAEEVSEENLPEMLGGSAELVLIQDAVRQRKETLAEK